MANPTFKEGSLRRRKQIALPLNENDAAVVVQNAGIHNATPLTLADGDVALPQLDDLGNLKVVIGDPAKAIEIAFTPIEALNKSYEGTLTAGNSPITIDFNADTGRNGLDGWITCDGPGDISVQFSRDGVTFGDAWTMKAGENSQLRNFDVDSLKITRISADSNYRIVLI